MRITGLRSRPAKSLGDMAVRWAAEHAAGFSAGEREWPAVIGRGGGCSGGDLPRMALSRATQAEGRPSVIRPDGGTMDADHGVEAYVVTQHRRAFGGVDAGAQAFAFPSDWPGRPVWRVRIGATARLARDRAAPPPAGCSLAAPTARTLLAKSRF